jgi:hypothetical protein
MALFLFCLSLLPHIPPPFNFSLSPCIFLYPSLSLSPSFSLTPFFCPASLPLRSLHGESDVTPVHSILHEHGGDTYAHMGHGQPYALHQLLHFSLILRVAYCLDLVFPNFIPPSSLKPTLDVSKQYNPICRRNQLRKRNRRKKRNPLSSSSVIHPASLPPRADSSPCSPHSDMCQ